MKLQKNLDKNKFGLVKKLLTNKSVLLSNKKVLLVDKKKCGVAEKKGNSAQHHHPPTLQHSTYTTHYNKKGYGTKNHVPTH